MIKYHHKYKLIEGGVHVHVLYRKQVVRLDVYRCLHVRYLPCRIKDIIAKEEEMLYRIYEHVRVYTGTPEFMRARTDSRRYITLHTT